MGSLGNSLSTAGHIPEDRVTEFHCTGFSKFHDVAVNPTELLMRELKFTLKAEPLPDNAVLASATVIETDARVASGVLRQLYEQPEKRRRIYVHCGVDVSIPRFQLEIQGRNEATFSCPDESGWMPCKMRIEPEKHLANTRTTDLPLGDLVGRLRRRGFDAELSRDAGKYVCNWVYYNSLKLAEQMEKSSAIFVHFPDLATVSLKDDITFLVSLIGEMANLPTMTSLSSPSPRVLEQAFVQA